MMGFISRAWDRFRGTGDAAVTIPPMDGVFRPNRAIEDAFAVIATDRPDNLAFDGVQVLFTRGKTVQGFAPGAVAEGVRQIDEFDSDIRCLAAHPVAGLVAGLERGALLVKPRRGDSYELMEFGGRRALCPVAVSFLDERTVYVCLGSQQTTPGQWKRDLMSRHVSGSVWKLDLAKRQAVCVADRLAYPNGVVALNDGSLIVSESWKHRLIRIAANGAVTVAMDDLPAYPGRIQKSADGESLWLSCFAPRRQLVEFVLRERDYCERMMKEIEPLFWLAPSLHAPRSHLETIQVGGIRHLGELKPWSPTQSYGLVLEFDARLRPVRSFHSRADGKRHGVTSCLAAGAHVYLASQGGDVILDLNRTQGAAA